MARGEGAAKLGLEEEDGPAVLDEKGIAEDELCLEGVGASNDGIVGGIAAYAGSRCCIPSQHRTSFRRGRMRRGRWSHMSPIQRPWA